MLKRGADIEKSMHYNKYATPLYFASNAGHLDIAKILLNAGAKLNKLFLTNAVYSRNTKLVDFYLSQGLDINCYDEDYGSSTPLITSIWQEDLNMTRFLISKGADINGKHGYESIVSSAVNTSNEILELLTEEGLSKRNINEAFKEAAKKGALDKVKILYEAGAKGLTRSLEAAAATGGKLKERLDVIKYLHSKGASITNQALRNAASSGSFEIARYLVSNGAEPHEALYRTAESGKNQVLKFLVEADGTITERTNQYSYRQAFEELVENGNLEMVRFFASQGYKIDRDEAIGYIKTAKAEGFTEIERIIKEITRKKN